MKRNSTRAIAKIALTAAIYVAVSYIFAFMASGEIQFRIAEMLNLLAIFNPIYIAGVTLGCLITNILTSPFGLLDIIMGSLATLIATTGIWFCRKNIWAASLFPLINGPIVALVVALAESLFGVGYWFVMISVTLSEFLVVTVIGVPVFLQIKKNQKLVDLLTND